MMRVCPRPLAFLHPYFRSLALGFFALWLVLQPFAGAAHAANPVLDFFSALKDGQSAGQIQAAEYALRQSFQARKISQQYYTAGEAISQRLVNELASKHPDSSVFAWMENRTRDSILSDPPNHASDLQAAANLIYAEAVRETANPPKPGAAASATARREEPSATAKAPAPIEPASLPLQQKKKLPPAQAITILAVLIAGIAGLVFLMRRRRKPVNVSYVQVKSPAEPAAASQSGQVPATDRGPDGR